MKLINLQITNLRKIRAAFFEFSTKGGVTKIVGGNQQAKSTVLDALMILFLGPKYMVDGSTTKGEDKTVISGELDNGYHIKRVFTEKTDRIELNRIIDGKMYPESSPQAFLDGITNQIAIRPIAFLNKPAAEKSKIISACLGINDVLEESNKKIKEYEESRTEIGKTIRAAGKLEQPNELTSADFKSVKEIQQRLDNAIEHNHSIDLAQQEILNAWKADKDEYERKQNQKQDLWNEMVDLEKRIDAMQYRFQDIVSEGFNLLSNIHAQITQHFVNTRGAYMATSYMVEMPGPPEGKIDLAPIKKEFETVVEDNTKVQKNIDLRELHAGIAKEQEKYDKHTAYIEELRKQRAYIISGAAQKANFPFAVDIVDNNIQIEGIGSENWSTSQGLLFALEACKLLNPQLKVICIDNAEAFDESRRAYVEKWAEDNDIQTIITIVSQQIDSDENTYFIEEGSITNTAVILDKMESQIPVKEEKPAKKTKVAKIISDVPEVTPILPPLPNINAIDVVIPPDDDDW